MSGRAKICQDNQGLGITFPLPLVTLLSGKIHTLSMSSGALKNQAKQNPWIMLKKLNCQFPLSSANFLAKN